MSAAATTTATSAPFSGIPTDFEITHIHGTDLLDVFNDLRTDVSFDWRKTNVLPETLSWPLATALLAVFAGSEELCALPFVRVLIRETTAEQRVALWKAFVTDPTNPPDIHVADAMGAGEINDEGYPNETEEELETAFNNVYHPVNAVEQTAPAALWLLMHAVFMLPFVRFAPRGSDFRTFDVRVGLNELYSEEPYILFKAAGNIGLVLGDSTVALRGLLTSETWSTQTDHEPHEARLMSSCRRFRALEGGAMFAEIVGQVHKAGVHALGDNLDADDMKFSKDARKLIDDLEVSMARAERYQKELKISPAGAMPVFVGYCLSNAASAASIEASTAVELLFNCIDDDDFARTTILREFRRSWKSDKHTLKGLNNGLFLTLALFAVADLIQDDVEKGDDDDYYPAATDAMRAFCESDAARQAWTDVYEGALRGGHVKAAIAIVGRTTVCDPSATLSIEEAVDKLCAFEGATDKHRTITRHALRSEGFGLQPQRGKPGATFPIGFAFSTFWRDNHKADAEQPRSPAQKRSSTDACLPEPDSVRAH